MTRSVPLLPTVRPSLQSRPAGARPADEQVYPLAALPDGDLSDPAIAQVVTRRLAGLRATSES